MTTSPSRFQIGETDFLLDGQPHRIISGAMHYPRVHPEQWRDRIRKARLMGLNAIETYVAWNAHEPVRGQWSQTGAVDLGRFLDLDRRGGHARDRAPRALRLRGVAQRRAADLAHRRPVDEAPQLRPALPRGGHRLPRAGQRDHRPAADRPGRLGHPRADRERVRRVRLRQGLSRRAHPAHARSRHHRPAHPGRPADPAHARKRCARGPAQDRLVRLPHPRAPGNAARAPAHRAAHVHGVLVRLVRPLGREAPHHRLRRQRRRPRRAAQCRGIRQHLHGARRHELRPHRGRERLRPLPADGHVVRLRLARSASRATSPRSSARSATSSRSTPRCPTSRSPSR